MLHVENIWPLFDIEPQKEVESFDPGFIAPADSGHGSRKDSDDGEELKM